MQFAVPHWSRSVLQAQPHPCSSLRPPTVNSSRVRHPFELSRQIRERVQDDTGIELAAVLVIKEHPTDIRHNSKIDRPALGEWASKVLAGA